MDLRPSDACCIIETDMEVEFAETKNKKKSETIQPTPGKRADGKMPCSRTKEVVVVKPWEQRLPHGVRVRI